MYTNSNIHKCARRNILTEVFQIIYADNLPLSRLDRSPYFQLCGMWVGLGDLLPKKATDKENEKQ